MSALLCRFADPELTVASHHADTWFADQGCIRGTMSRLSDILNTIEARDDDEVAAHDTAALTALRYALDAALVLALKVERRA